MDKNTTAALQNFINTAIKQPIGKYVLKHHKILTTAVGNFINTTIKHTTPRDIQQQLLLNYCFISLGLIHVLRINFFYSDLTLVLKEFGFSALI